MRSSPEVGRETNASRPPALEDDGRRSGVGRPGTARGVAASTRPRQSSTDIPAREEVTRSTLQVRTRPVHASTQSAQRASSTELCSDRGDAACHRKPTPRSTCTGCRWAPAATPCALNGKVFEAVAAWLDRRDRRDLYHSALEVQRAGGTVRDRAGAGAGERRRRARRRRRGRRRQHAAARPLPRSSATRSGAGATGCIPDVGEAVESPRRLSDDPDCARRLLELVPAGADARLGPRRAGRRRDVELELDSSPGSSRAAGSTSRRSRRPRGGRAPGWQAGIVIARRPHS